MKFITPVSMKCTKGQFERDLKEPLSKLGYMFGSIRNFNDYPILATNVSDSYYHVSNLDELSKTDHNRYFIDHYNPKLFLALSAMSDEANGIFGEWFKDNKEELFLPKNKTSIQTYFCPKATKEELINRFTKKEESKEQESGKIANLMSDILQLSKRAIELIDEEIKEQESGFVEVSIHKEIVNQLEERASKCEKKLAETESERFKLSLKIAELEEKNLRQHEMLTDLENKIISIKNVLSGTK